MDVVNWDLGNLDQDPEWRGAIDHFDGRWLRGWAVSARAPLEPVRLDIRLIGVALPVMWCDFARDDISCHFPQPLLAGFSIDLSRLTPDLATALLQGLAAHETDLKIGGLLEIRVGGSALRLPFSPGVAEQVLEVRAFRQMLETVLAEHSAPPDPVVDIPPEPVLPVWPARLEVIAFLDPYLRPAGLPHTRPPTGREAAPAATGWTQIAATRALFPGHDQPRLPGTEPGFYDPRAGAALGGQIALARAHGLTGFCYPLASGASGQALIARHLGLPSEEGGDFGLCLQLQLHPDDAADPVALLRAALPHLAAPAYIRLAGAALLLIDGLEHLPSPAETLAQWRAIAREAGIPALHLCLLERGALCDPRPLGCDSSCQPLPAAPALPLLQSSALHTTALSTTAGPGGIRGDYAGLVAAEIARPAAGHLRLGCALPGFDDSPLQGAGATIWQGASPALFAAWVGHLADLAQQSPAAGRAIFINAWNGWAGGAYLEPDQQLGPTRLVALRDALAMDDEYDLDPMGLDTEPVIASPDLPRQLAGLARANAALTGLLRRRALPGAVSAEAATGRPADHGTFVPAPPDLLRVAPHPGARARIERVNGLPPPDGLLPLTRSGGIAIDGWALLPGTDPFPALLSLLGDQGRRHVALLRQALPRPDLAQAPDLADHSAPVPAAPWGFSFRGPLGGLPAGRYRIELLRPDRQDPGLAHAAETGCLLLIG